MHIMIKALVLGLLTVGLIACSDTNENRNSGGGWDIGPGEDAGTMRYKINFELLNESGAPIYAYKTVEKLGACGGFGDQHWLTIERDGEAVRAGDDCGYCNCEDVAEGHCAVCSVDCGGLPSAESTTLADGEARQFEWDGRVWSLDSVSSCIAPELAAGETFEATICYGTEFFEDEASHISNPTCETIAFTLDQPEQTVRVVVPAPA